jgi:amino acid transporter
MLTGGRIFFAMADDGLFFKTVAKVHPRFKTPYVAVMLNASIGIAFVLLRTFEQLADIFVTASLVFYVLSIGAIFKLRRRPDWNPPVRTPLYPVVPVLFVAAVLFLLVNALLDPAQRVPTLQVFGVILVGVPIFFLTVGKRANG